MVLSGTKQELRGAATGFVIRVGLLPPTGMPDFFLVTARHVVLDALAFQVTLAVSVIHDYHPHKAIQDRVSIPLNMTQWLHNDKSDVSMIPFPVDALPADHNLSAISERELASRKPGVMIPQGADLDVYGRWGVTGGKDIAVRRSATVATFERPSTFLAIGGASQLVEVYLVNGTASRGMSGGPVTFASSGWGGSAVIGLVHGYSSLDQADLATPGTVGDANLRREALAELAQEVRLVNSGIFYVVPIEHLEPLLATAGFPHSLAGR